MKTSLVYIFLLLVVILYPVESRAFQSIGEDSKHSSAHNSLSCLDCHSHIKADSDHPSVEDSNDSCLGCHEFSSGFTYSGINKVKCLNCHSRHHEKVAGDAHINVPCKACHQSDMKPLKETEDNAPVWRLEPVSVEEYDPHMFISEKDDICSRCHFKGNNLGVSNHVLPPKSIICMPCHTATFSIGDIPSAAAVII
ncbi:MAG: cytochrome c3 family protein, partial [Deltaproteobacteria bacterium]|nr:cytochrome c3 family protein [Deltaproteobacteria bacterium]